MFVLWPASRLCNLDQLCLACIKFCEIQNPVRNDSQPIIAYNYHVPQNIIVICNRMVFILQFIDDSVRWHNLAWYHFTNDTQISLKLKSTSVCLTPVIRCAPAFSKATKRSNGQNQWCIPPNGSQSIIKFAIREETESIPS
jgi:hypothetical protein